MKTDRLRQYSGWIFGTALVVTLALAGLSVETDLIGAASLLGPGSMLLLGIALIGLKCFFASRSSNKPND